MALSIDNLGREDLVTVLGGFINQTQQINEAENKYSDRYDEIRYEHLLAEYKKPKNLIKAYLLAPFYVLKGKKLKEQTHLEVAYKTLAQACGVMGALGLFGVPLEIIGLLFGGSLDELPQCLIGILMGILGYFMGRKKYMEHWFSKKAESGDLDAEIDAAVASDPQSVNYKNEYSGLVNDETYQQYLSLIPNNFTLDDIVGIHQVLSDYRADNFKEAVNVWRQEQHNQRVENKLNDNSERISQMESNVTDLGKRQDKVELRSVAMAKSLDSVMKQAKDAANSAKKAVDQAEAASSTANSAKTDAQNANYAANKTENRLYNLKNKNDLQE